MCVCAGGSGFGRTEPRTSNLWARGIWFCQHIPRMSNTGNGSDDVGSGLTN